MRNRSGLTPNASCLVRMEAQKLRLAASAITHHQGNNQLTTAPSPMPAARRHAAHETSQPRTMASLIDLLRARASAMGEKRVFSFLRGDGALAASVTYRGLHERAMAIGGELQTLASPGDRVLLLFPPGLDFIAAFFGCLYAGVVAVPAAPPGRNRSTSSVEAIFEASKPALILSTADHHRAGETVLRPPVERCWSGRGSPPTRWRTTASTRGAIPQVDGRQTAFLQYTSGSTSSPKGVMLSHENLLHNAAVIQRAFGNTPDSSAVFWLPLYHDMGLDRRGGAADLLRRLLHAAGPGGVPAAAGLVAGDDLAHPGHRQRRARTSPMTCASARSRPRNVRAWT